MLRQSFPEEDVAWRREVERLLQSHAVDLTRIQQIAGPAQSSGVVIGGNPPTELQCLHFKFTIDPNAADAVNGTSCGDAPDCLLVTLPAGITGTQLGCDCPADIAGRTIYLPRLGGCAWRNADYDCDCRAWTVVRNGDIWTFMLLADCSGGGAARSFIG